MTFTYGAGGNPQDGGADVAVSAGPGNLTINLEYDSNAQGAPQSFRDGIQSAADLLSAAISNAITVNIDIGFGEVPGFPGTLSPGGAAAAPATSVPESYSTLRSQLLSHAATPQVLAAINALPNTSSLNGITTEGGQPTPVADFQVPYAEARALGVPNVPASDSTVDGDAGFGTMISPDFLVGVALHELTHAMGRIPGGSLLSLFRYTSQGVHDFIYNWPTGPSYFSIDGGLTDLADFGQTSDPSDFLNSSTPNDPFNEFYGSGTLQQLTPLDLLLLGVLGFDVPAPTPSTVAQAIAAYNANHSMIPVVVSDTAADVAAGLDSLRMLTANDKLTSITVTDLATPLAITAGQASSNAATLALISGAYHATVTDTAAHVAGNLDALQALAAQGHLAAIALTDAADPVSTTAGRVTADAAALAHISGKYDLAVLAGGGNFNYALASNVTGLTVTGEASSNITGNNNFDTITVQSGANIVNGGNGGSYIVGTGSDDVLIGGGGTNSIYAEGNGSNYLQGGSSSTSDVLVATGSGNDTFYGGSGNSYMVGGRGKNTIVGGGGALQSLYGNGAVGDYIVGGSSSTASNVLVENGTGAAQLWGGAGNNYEVGGPGNDLLVGGSGPSSTNYIFGGAGDDTVYGGAGANYIYPGPGNDFIWTNPAGIYTKGHDV